MTTTEDLKSADPNELVRFDHPMRRVSDHLPPFSVVVPCFNEVECIRSTVESLAEVTVASGAELIVADVNSDNLKMTTDELPATVVSPTDLLFADVDVLAPCALGNILTSSTIPKIKAKIVAGAANNQLSTPADGVLLAEREILYAPDYVINAGGIINVSIEVEGEYDEARARVKVENIYHALKRVFEISKERNISTNEASNYLAEERLRKPARA